MNMSLQMTTMTGMKEQQIVVMLKSYLKEIDK